MDIDSIISDIAKRNRSSREEGVYMNPNMFGLAGRFMDYSDKVSDTIANIHSGFDSKFYKFFSSLYSLENIEFPKFITDHFISLKSINKHLYEFVEWKLSLQFSTAIIDYLTGFPSGFKDFEISNFRNKLVCVAVDTNQDTKLFTFEVRYYAGYYINKADSTDFVYLSDKEEFNEINDPLEFLDDEETPPSYYILSARERAGKKKPIGVSHEDIESVLNSKFDIITKRVVAVDQNTINCFNNLEPINGNIKSKHRLKANGCIAGFAYEIRLSVENTGKEIRLGDYTDDFDRITFEAPNFAFINDKRIKLTPDQYYLFYYFVPHIDRGKFTNINDFKDMISNKGISEFNDKSEKALRSSFERIKDKIEKEGFKNLIEIQGFNVCIHEKADK